MPIDIFYSEVDANLQLELNARGRAGFSSRTNKDLNFMLGKIANVQITPYNDAKYTVPILEAILGGELVRTPPYLPSGPAGFLSEQTTNILENIIINDKIQKLENKYINNTRRTPPYITSCEISTTDGSMGLLNTATINITIPNPEGDLNFIESVYMRPGRHCRIEIAHPKEALVAYSEDPKSPTLLSHGGLLTSSSLGVEISGIEKVPENIDATLEEVQLYGKLNHKVWNGIITSFTLQYESDMSVTATLDLRGGSIRVSEQSINTTTDLPESTKELSDEEKTAEAKKIIDEETKKQEAAESSSKTFFEKISYDAKRSSDKKNFFISDTQQTPNCQQTYISVGYLIAHCNEHLIKNKDKNKLPTDEVPSFSIICNKETCTSIYYEHLVSSDPQNVLLPGSKYGTNTWTIKYTPGNPKDMQDNPDPYSTEYIDSKNNCTYPSMIFVNETLIENIHDSVKKSKIYTIGEFLRLLGDSIRIATCGAIDMQLITPPKPRAGSNQYFYDIKKASPFDKKKIPVPYSIPMFSNHPNGSIVHEFSFSGKLPTDASTLAYVANQDPSAISESEIAPFVAWMYNANTVERSAGTETIGSLITQEQYEKQLKSYKTKHDAAHTKLKDAIESFRRQPETLDRQISLKNALNVYLQYPTASPSISSQLTAPVIPFDASVTIDGINGFHYGNVLDFTGLPSRYRNNCVFFVASVTDSVDSSGKWTTAIRCVMRSKIEA